MENIYALQQFLVDTINQHEHMRVIGEGDGYDNGEFADIEIEVGGEKYYINISELEED